MELVYLLRFSYTRALVYVAHFCRMNYSLTNCKTQKTQLIPREADITVLLCWNSKSLISHLTHFLLLKKLLIWIIISTLTCSVLIQDKFREFWSLPRFKPASCICRDKYEERQLQDNFIFIASWHIVSEVNLTATLPKQTKTIRE